MNAAATVESPSPIILKELLSFQEILLDALDQISVAVVAVASDDRILFFNKTFASLWKLSENLTDDLADRIASLTDDASNQHTDYVMWQDGRIFQRYSSPVANGTGINLGRVWVLRDVTESKRAEQAAQQSEEYLKILNELHQSILTTQSSYSIAKVVLSKIATLLPYPQSSVTLFDVRHQALLVLATNLTSARYLTEGRRFPFDAVTSPVNADPIQEIRNVEQITRSELPSSFIEIVQAEGIRAVLNVPLVVGTERIGILNLYAAAPVSPTPAQIETARHVSDILAVALQQARLHEQINTTRERVQALSRRQMESEEIQRRQIARELHDMVGQNLTALNFNLHAIRRRLPDDTPPNIRTRLDDSSQMVEEIVSRIRNIMSELRPSILDDLGLHPALRWYATEFSARTDIPTQVEADEIEPRLPPPVETALFRIAQEALTNVAKHAHAKQVNIRLEARPDTVTLKIIDDGIGFDFPAMRRNRTKNGVGLVDMRERAEGVGGHIWVECQPGQGTQVLVDVPR